MAVLGEKTVYERELKLKDLLHAAYPMLEIEFFKAEEEFAKTRKLPDPESTTNLEFQKVLDPSRYHEMERLVVVSGETTTAVKGQMRDSGTLPFVVINTNGLFNKKLDDLNGSRASFIDVLKKRATDAMIAGKVAVGRGYGDVGNPFHTHMDKVAVDVDKDIIMVDHMKKMKNIAIVGNIGHFDNNFYMHGFETFPDVEKFTVKPHMDKSVFPDTDSGINVLAEGRLMNLGCATGHPSFVMSCPFTKQAAEINVPVERFTSLTTTDTEEK